MELEIKKKSKFQVDKETAWNLRSEVILALNKYFVANQLPLNIRFIHQYAAPKQESATSRKNTITNRVSDINPDSALGFDCLLENTETKQTIYILIRFSDDASCYIKDTSENLHQPKYLIDTLVNKNAYFLYAKKHNKKALNLYSNLIPLSNFKNKWILDTSPGNANRIIFPAIIPGALSYNDINQSNLFGTADNLITQIKSILL